MEANDPFWLPGQCTTASPFGGIMFHREYPICLFQHGLCFFGAKGGYNQVDSADSQDVYSKVKSIAQVNFPKRLPLELQPLDMNCKAQIAFFYVKFSANENAKVLAAPFFSGLEFSKLVI